MIKDAARREDSIDIIKLKVTVPYTSTPVYRKRESFVKKKKKRKKVSKTYDDVMNYRLSMLSANIIDF